jgi:hypothetical protein
MNKLEDIKVSEITGEELLDRGYHLISYAGGLCLPCGQDTKENVNEEGNLTLKGSQVLAIDTLKNLEDVRDVKIAKNNDAYDVYALF